MRESLLKTTVREDWKNTLLMVDTNVVLDVLLNRLAIAQNFTAILKAESKEIAIGKISETRS